MGQTSVVFLPEPTPRALPSTVPTSGRRIPTVTLFQNSDISESSTFGGVNIWLTRIDRAAPRWLLGCLGVTACRARRRDCDYFGVFEAAGAPTLLANDCSSEGTQISSNNSSFGRNLIIL